MRNTRDDEEAYSLLTDEIDNINLKHKINLPKLYPVITRGVALHLAKWPSHLFTIFMSVCILSIALSLITFAATIIFAIDVNSRISRNVKMEEYPNLYFVKHASHAWSQDELCAIESSAREYPDLNVYLVNFLMHQLKSTPITPVNTSLTLNSATTEDSANALTSRYMNVRSIDVVAHTLFRKSPLERVYEKFDAGTLLIAVKSQLLWNYSGIAIDPSQIQEIRNLGGYICRPTESCKPMKNAAISLDGSLQVSPCPCHAFYELFLKVLSNKFNNKGRIVKDTYKSFCNGQEKCLGAEIFTYKSVTITEHLLCPMILPEDFHTSKDLISYRRTTPSQHHSSPTGKKKSIETEILIS